jgi:hypothetical protein
MIIGQIFTTELPGTMIEFHTMSRSGLSHTGISLFTDVPGPGTAGFNFKLSR